MAPMRSALAMLGRGVASFGSRGLGILRSAAPRTPMWPSATSRATETVRMISEGDHYLFALSVFGLTICSGYVMAQCWKIIPSARTPVPEVDYGDD